MQQAFTNKHHMLRSCFDIIPCNENKVQCFYSLTFIDLYEQNQKTTKKCYLKNCPPIKLKQLSLSFILNHINNSFYQTKI